MVAAVITVRRRSMSIATTRRDANGADLDPMVRDAIIALLGSIAMVPALTNAFGAAQPPMALAATTAPPANTRSEIEV